MSECQLYMILVKKKEETQSDGQNWTIVLSYAKHDEPLLNCTLKGQQISPWRQNL